MSKAVLKSKLAKARQQQLDKRKSFKNGTELRMSSSLLIDLSKLKCKDYYWMFITEIIEEAVGPKK